MIKLYDEDSYINEFSAEVVECIPNNGNYRIVLDKTAFFPTAGGQLCDSGTILGESVISVEIENETVYHIMKNPINIGTTVIGRVDWDIRFRKMQHHSAEHIVSGLAHTMFGVSNVGFHLNDKEVTIDYDKELSHDDILQLERAANIVVQKNIPIIAEYPDIDTLKKTDYRSKKELTGDIRLVTIPDIDVCACCAPHVRSTGEIGVIKLKDAMRHRGGMRLYMICGNDALYDYESMYNNARKISALLCAKQDEISDGVERVMDELEAMKQKYSALSKQLASLKAEIIPETKGVYCVFDDMQDADSMRVLANAAKDKCGIIAVFSGNDKNGYNYIIASETVNLQDLSKTINKVLNGRGGGSPKMIQGLLKGKQSEIEEFFYTTLFNNDF